MSPPASSGVSRCVISVLRRSRCERSRRSRARCWCARRRRASQSACRRLPRRRRAVYRLLTMRTTSAALACSIGITSMSSSPVWSMRWMIRIMRLTFDGAIGNDQHVRGRVGREVTVLRDQRSQDRHELRGADVLTAITCVTISSDVELTRDGRSLRRHLARVRVGQDLDDVAGRARRRSRAPAGSTGTPRRTRSASSASRTASSPARLTRGSTMKFLPVTALTASMICERSASL